MAVVDDERVARVRVRVESLGQEDVRAEEHVAPPELREQLAPDAHVLDVLRVGRLLQRRDDLVELETDRAAAPAVPPHLLRRAIDVAGRAVPLLALAAIHRQLDGVARGQTERLVLVQQRLHRVLARRKRRQRLERIAEHRGVERPLVAGLQPVDVDAEDLRRRQARGAHLEARFAAPVLRQQQQKPSVERLLRAARSEADDDAGRLLSRRPDAWSLRSHARHQKRTDERDAQTIHVGLLNVRPQVGTLGAAERHDRNHSGPVEHGALYGRSSMAGQYSRSVSPSIVVDNPALRRAITTRVSGMCFMRSGSPRREASSLQVCRLRNSRRTTSPGS